MKKPHWILIGITCAFLCLILGIFIGRNLSDTHLTIENAGDTNISVTQSSQTDDADETESSETEIKDGKININTATANQLELLPGIGEVIAQRIVDYRTESGPFQSVDDLLNVSGIGEKKLEQIKPYAKVE